MLESLSQKYGTIVPEGDIEKWRKAYNKVKKSFLPILTFSDNPSSERSPKHGLWGIGKDYTWMKMDEKPRLESVRQALLEEDMRIKISSENKYIPESLPKVWIKSVEIKKTAINPKLDNSVKKENSTSNLSISIPSFLYRLMQKRNWNYF